MEHPIFISRIPYNNNITKETLGQWCLDSEKVYMSTLFKGTLKDIIAFKNRQNINYCAIQRFNSDHRVGKHSEEYTFAFNHCVFIDIDYCKVKTQTVSPEDLRSALKDALKDQPGFYYMENSMHKGENGNYTNFHLVFYEKRCDVIYYEFYYVKYHKIVKNILDKLGINTDECLDENVSNPTQLMFLTGINHWFNENWIEPQTNYKEFADWYKEYKAREDKENCHATQQVNPKDYFIGFARTFPQEHLGYTQRWYLFGNLCKVLSGDDLKAHWKKLMLNIPTGKHSVEYYIEEPWNHDWLESSSQINHVNNTLLTRYGVIYRDVEKIKKFMKKYHL